MIIHLLVWAFIIASWTLPQKWFSSENQWRAARLSLSGLACGIAIGEFLKILGIC
jgi:hypothetical protein